MKIGLIADTHMPGSLADLWPQASRAFEGVDAILHAGDLHTLEIVEHLSDIAPTYVSRGNGDLDIVDHRLQDTWVIELGNVSIGLIHHFPSPIRKSPDRLERHLNKHFPTWTPTLLSMGIPILKTSEASMAACTSIRVHQHCPAISHYAWGLLA